MTKKISIIIIFVLFSCYNRETIVDKSKLLGDDYRLFQNTPAYELAKAVEDNNEDEIKIILKKDSSLLDYQEPIFGSTLLMLTIRNQQMKAFKILLENKPNLEIRSSFDGSSALIEACDYRTINIKYIELLLKNGANVNAIQLDIEKEGLTKTPLMKAVTTGKSNLVNLLIEYGAEINYYNKYGQSALSVAVMTNNYKTAYILLKNGADYRKPIFYRIDYSAPPDSKKAKEKGIPMYIEDLLKEDISDYDDDVHKLLIIDFLKNKGINY